MTSRGIALEIAALPWIWSQLLVAARFVLLSPPMLLESLGIRPLKATQLSGASVTALRSVTLAARLMLVIVLAHELTPRQVGEYGVVAGGITIVVVGLGLNFYLHTLRTIAEATPSVQVLAIRDQAVLNLVAQAIFIGIFLIAHLVAALPVYVTWPVLFVALAEYAGQEAYRTLIALSKPILANIILFVRQGLWVAILGLLWVFDLVGKSLGAVWYAWLLGSVAGLVISALYLSRLPWRLTRSTAVNWAWIHDGLSVSARLGTATIGVTILNVCGRYALAATHGTDSAGVYTVLASLTSPIQTFAEASVVAVMMPAIIGSYSRHAHRTTYRLLKDLAGQLRLVLAILLPAVLCAAWLVLRLLGRPSYLGQMAPLVILALSGTVVVLSLPHHVELFTRRRDGDLMIAALGSAIAAVAATWGGAAVLGIPGAALGTGIGSLTLYILRAYFVRRTRRLTSPAIVL